MSANRYEENLEGNPALQPGEQSAPAPSSRCTSDPGATGRPAISASLNRPANPLADIAFRERRLKGIQPMLPYEGFETAPFAHVSKSAKSFSGHPIMRAMTNGVRPNRILVQSNDIFC